MNKSTTAAGKGKTPQPHAQARLRLLRRDATLAAIIRRVGPCTLQPDGDPFTALTRSIVAQLISTPAARTIYARLNDSLGTITPASVIAAGHDRLRALGLSRAKAAAIIGVAESIDSGTLPVDRLHELDDEEVISRLVPIHGIGRWTAEMFLIFCLGRPDVLPVGDLGLRAGVQEHYQLSELPGRRVLEEIGERWRPYRSIATWYIWRSRGFVPQSGVKASG
jgi:3-methyladenine DNA glycosylase/8-oxoguanine DNA glycosylase